MIRCAFSSATLIGSDIEDVVRAAAEAGVGGIEWSDDGFLEPGDGDSAFTAMMATLRAGMCTASYSTLYRPGLHAPARFDAVLATASALHAPTVRLWAPPLGPRGRPGLKAFAETARALGDRAARDGVTLCFSLAYGTVLDSYRRASDAMKRINHPFVKLCWEPLPDSGFDNDMEALSALKGHVGLLCARLPSCGPGPGVLGGLDEEWLHYMDAFDEQGGSPDMSRYVILRSCCRNDKAGLKSDARLVRTLSDKLRRYRRRRVI